MKRLLALAIAAILVCAGCSSETEPSSASTPASTFTMTGTIEPYADDFPGQTRGPSLKPDGKWDLGDMPEIGDLCTTDVVSPGDQVTVTDEDGKVVALGEWSPGTYQSDDTASFCRFTYTIADVPEGSKFYGVKFGDNDIIQLTRVDAENAVFTIGGSAHGPQ